MKPSPENIVEAIQRLVVRVLDLSVPPETVDAERPMATMDISYEGRTYEFDSVDLVEVLSTLEDELQTDLLEDPALTDLVSRGTLHAFAAYLADRVDVAKLARFCDSVGVAA
jgi:acyl carrier protein